MLQCYVAFSALMMENRQCWCILLSYRLQPALPGLMAEVMVTLGCYNPHLTLAMALARVRPGSGHDLLGAKQEIFSIIHYRLYSWMVRQTDSGQPDRHVLAGHWT